MIVTIDTETTTWNKGHPFDPRNFLVCYSWASNGVGNGARKWDRGGAQELIDRASVLVFFNGKFDLQWLAKEGVSYDYTKVWDVQLGEFILSNQTLGFPSLDETCAKYGLSKKLDVVKTEYWDKGVNTDAIPWEVLSEYAEHDAVLTLQCYHKQLALMTPAQKMLCQLQSQDLSILREMEANGIPFNEELCQVRAKELDEEIATLNELLTKFYPNVPINFGSNHHLSAFLYGGVVKEDAKEFVGYFKTGERKGQPKYRNIVIEHQLPRQYTPLKGTEMSVEGLFATDEGTLRKLKGKRSTVDLLLKLSKMEKLNGTYYKGLIKLRETMGWPVGLLHGNFNQTTAKTGRLSSTKPNLQNFATELQDIFTSKYNE
jgi:DNA polymerase I-like protein with 3'-5' exonuclease and polymerase domains